MSHKFTQFFTPKRFFHIFMTSSKFFMLNYIVTHRNFMFLIEKIEKIIKFGEKLTKIIKIH